MTTKHTHRLPILLSIAGEEREIEVEVFYAVTPGHPATPPSYASGGDPPVSAEIEVTGGHVVSEPDCPVAPLWLLNIIENSDEAFQALGDAADWGIPYRDPDDERDRRRDDALTQAQP